MWRAAYPRTTTLRQNILRLSNLLAKRDKSIWSSKEGSTENEGLTGIRLLHSESCIHKGLKRRTEGEFENLFDKFFLSYGSGCTIVCGITYTVSVVETLSPLHSSYVTTLCFPFYLRISIFLSWFSPSLSFRINLFLNPSTFILPRFLPL